MGKDGVKVEGASRLYARLRGLAKKHGAKTPQVVVGYTMHYALWVHENLEALHPNGEAKYLERPLKEYRKHMQGMVAGYVKKGIKLAKALFMTGLFLQRKSQELVPVDTGALKGSAFTEVVG